MGHFGYEIAWLASASTHVWLPIRSRDVRMAHGPLRGSATIMVDGVPHRVRVELTSSADGWSGSLEAGDSVLAVLASGSEYRLLLTGGEAGQVVVLTSDRPGSPLPIKGLGRPPIA